MQQPLGDDDAPDEALIRRSLQNSECFAVIFDRHARAIYRYLSRRVGPAADDLLGETFLAAFRSRATYIPDRALVRPWLFGIATNVLRHHARVEERRYRALSRLTPEAPEVLMADNAVIRVDAQALRGELSRVLASLAAGDRDVLLLAAWADLSYGEIATVLEIPVGTVRSRLNRARRITRSSLGPAWPNDQETS